MDFHQHFAIFFDNTERVTRKIQFKISSRRNETVRRLLLCTSLYQRVTMGCCGKMLLFCFHEVVKN